MLNPRNITFGITTLIWFALDQASKIWVTNNIPYPPRVGDNIVVIPDWFEITHARNTGAAFSMAEGQMTLFIVFTLIAFVVIGSVLYTLKPQARFMPFVLGLLCAGALGNFVDRLRLGYVVDMIKNSVPLEGPRAWLIDQFGTAVWPIYNIADSVLLVGVALFLVHFLVFGDEQEEDEPLPDIEQL